MSSKREELVRQLTGAAERFEEVLKKAKNDIVRDSAIQRFEFTYELAWKAMKAYLEEKGVKELYSPKDVIKGAYQNKIIDNDPVWLEMVDTRNMTSHIYKEEMAEKVYAKLPSYLPLIKKLINQLS